MSCIIEIHFYFTRTKLCQPNSSDSSFCSLENRSAEATSAERVFELLDEPEEPAEAPAAATLPAPRGDVQFDHVAFSYKPDAPLIEDMSIHVASGQTVAIVGPTGAGKTTLVNLLMRFYDVNAGSIRVDGVDIRDLPRGGLRRMFGMVLQDTWLFSGTIRDNIAYGREGASEDAIVQAARAAQADHFIRTLPDNYDTVHQRRGHEPLTGAEAAVDHRLRVSRGPDHPHTGRGDQQRRHAAPRF